MLVICCHLHKQLRMMLSKHLNRNQEKWIILEVSHAVVYTLNKLCICLSGSDFKVEVLDTCDIETLPILGYSPSGLRSDAEGFPLKASMEVDWILELNGTLSDIGSLKTKGSTALQSVETENLSQRTSWEVEMCFVLMDTSEGLINLRVVCVAIPDVKLGDLMIHVVSELIEKFALKWHLVISAHLLRDDIEKNERRSNERHAPLCQCTSLVYLAKY